MSDNFSKASLKALKAIERDASVPKIVDGSLMVNRQTQSAIDDADVEAVSTDEKATVKVLNDLYTKHELNNLKRNTVHLQYESKAYGQKDSASALEKVDDAVAADPQVIEMDKAESACSNALEEMLRSRSFSIQATCTRLLGTK
jgi:hypothetical protein